MEQLWKPQDGKMLVSDQLPGEKGQPSHVCSFQQVMMLKTTSRVPDQWCQLAGIRLLCMQHQPPCLHCLATDTHS